MDWEFVRDHEVVKRCDLSVGDVVRFYGSAAGATDGGAFDPTIDRNVLSVWPLVLCVSEKD